MSNSSDSGSESHASYIPSLLFCSFGILTNALNIFVFVNARLKEQIFKYMLTMSIIDLFYCILAITESFVLCHSCSFYNTIYRQICFIYILQYFQSCLAIMNIFIELIISMERYMIVRNSKYLHSISAKIVLSTLCFISLCYYLPVLYVLDIRLESESDVYSTSNTEFGNTRSGMVIMLLLQLVRILLTILFLPILSVLTVVMMRRNFNKRGQLRRRNS